jgi:hypothetical protein
VDKKNENKPDNLTKKEVRIVNRNVVVFAFFLFLSFLFWYLNSLGKDQEVDIRYPVKYINLPNNRQFNEQPPAKLNLYLKGPGYSILRLKYSGNRAPAVIDFSRTGYKKVTGGKPTDYYLITSDLVQEINTQLKSECRITAIKPDTLYFSFTQSAR